MSSVQKLKDLAVSDSGFVFDPYTGSTFSVNAAGRLILKGRKELKMNLSPLISTLILCLVLGSWSPGTARGGTARRYQRSYEMEAAGQAAAAAKELRRCPAAAQGTYFFQLRLGWLLYLAADHAGAIRAYRRAAALEPRALEPILGLTLPQLALRRWQDAAATARAVLRKDAKSYLAQSRLAWALFNLGRFAESERVYVRVLELYPADLEMRSGLGWALLKQGKTAAALKTFRAVLAVSPKNRSAHDGAAAATAP